MSRRANWIAFVGPFAFPWGEPGSRRVYGLVGSLAAAGFDVVVAGGDAGPANEVGLDEIDGPGKVTYLGVGEAPQPGSGLLTSSTQMFLRWGRKTAEWLDRQSPRPSHVVVHGGMAQYMFHLQRWCRRNKVPLVADVVDWNNGRYVRGGVLGPLNLSLKVALVRQYPRCDGVIAISTLLETYYRNHGLPVLRIPPTLDVQNLKVEHHGSSGPPGLSLVYAGTPGRNKKDLLATIIRAVDQARRGGAPLNLRIFGPSPADVRALHGERTLPANVHVLGRIPQYDIPGVLQEADFSILVRRPERSTNAGFSTKFCESLANGTPVIVNLTGDMGDYLRHGVEGYVCRDHSLEALTETLRVASQSTAAERALMRVAARNRALKSFDYRQYGAAIGEFFDKLRR
ncbi:glycosyltransferase [Micromonospora chalcea]|uniref:glycosyltransferase n=1 Tax=Micromonospora chalcea TaxID=1874 RepID=UPI003819D194